jgi:hypothetical protein
MMKAIGGSFATLVALVLSAGCGKSDQAQPPLGAILEEVPMPGTQHIPIALISNYAFMGQMMSKGDGRSFATFYLDTATLARDGLEPLRGQIAIRDFVRNGDEWGILEFRRLSDGFTVEGRELTDSGHYEIIHSAPLPPNTIEPAGSYRTRWTFTKKGDWFIVYDSLFPVKKKQ